MGRERAEFLYASASEKVRVDQAIAAALDATEESPGSIGQGAR